MQRRRHSTGRERYYSKRDGWLVAILVGVLIAMSSSLLSGEFSDLGALVWGANGLCAALLVGALWMYYDLDSEKILIRAGFFRWTVPVSEILEMSYSTNPVSSPALSLDRLKIVYGDSRSEILISPSDRMGFMRAVASRGHGLSYDPVQKKVIRQGVPSAP